MNVRLFDSGRLLNYSSVLGNKPSAHMCICVCEKEMADGYGILFPEQLTSPHRHVAHTQTVRHITSQCHTLC